MIVTNINSRYALFGYFITSYRTRAHGIIVIYSSPLSANPAGLLPVCYFLTINGPFKRCHCHMLCEFSNIISCRFVACYNIGTPCSILMYVCLSNSELSGAFPDNLRKMTRASLLIIWNLKSYPGLQTSLYL